MDLETVKKLIKNIYPDTRILYRECRRRKGIT